MGYVHMVQCIYNNSAKVFVNIIIGVFYQSMSVCSQIIVCICFVYHTCTLPLVPKEHTLSTFCCFTLYIPFTLYVFVYTCIFFRPTPPLPFNTTKYDTYNCILD